eukprot:TRINITY_DN16454_c0_g6_i1.p1 TRINITY_DN16454_c0_g6~~TRINITY_DN16454_c0_g6_i1.p1  ORF type:complete len:1296 (+),score=233.85 TRINITY_DN16454_c0_g6_i1:125-4012(+)
MKFALAVLTLGCLCISASGQEKDKGSGSDGSFEHVGPALPGSERYWVKLKGLTPSEGSFKPPFDPNKEDFTVRINNPNVRSITFTIVPDLTKYNLLHCPLIEVDGKKLDYSPLNPLTHEIFVDENIGPHDETVVFRVADPIGPQGGVFGIASHQKAHDYNIRIMQPPEFDKVVELDHIKVETVDGQKIHPKKQGRAKAAKDNFEFWVPQAQQSLKLSVGCNKYATGIVWNGDHLPRVAQRQIELDTPEKMVIIQCEFDDKKWTETPVQRTYQVHFIHQLDSKSKPPEILMMPENGWCENKDFGDDKQGYVCRSGLPRATFVTLYDSSVIDLFLSDPRGSFPQTSLLNGMPRSVDLIGKEQIFILGAKGGGQKTTEFPLEFIVAANCDTMNCPTGWVPRPKLDEGMNAHNHLCRGAECSIEEDGEHCCRKPGTPCTSFEESLCPKHTKLFKEGFCHSQPCKPTDWEYCCLGNAGYFGPDGRYAGGGSHGKSEDYWKKQSKGGEKALEKYSSKISFNWDMEVPSVKKFIEDKNAVKSIEKITSQKMGVQLEHVKASVGVSAGGVPLDKKGTVFAAVSVMTLDGAGKEAKLVQTADTSLDKNDATQSLIRDLESSEACLNKPGCPGLEVISFSQAKLVHPKPPKLDRPIDVAVPKSITDGIIDDAMRNTCAKLADVRKDQVKTTKTEAMDKPAKEPDMKNLEIMCEISFPADPSAVGGVSLAFQKLAAATSEKANKIFRDELRLHFGAPLEEVKKVHVLGLKAAKSAGGGIDESDLMVKTTTTSTTHTTNPPPSTTTPSTTTSLAILATTTPYAGMKEVTVMEIRLKGTDYCLDCEKRQSLGSKVVNKPCVATDRGQKWIFDSGSGKLQNTFGICVTTTSPPWPHGPVYMWKCEDDMKEQQWIFDEKTEQFRFRTQPEFCIQVDRIKEEQVKLSPLEEIGVPWTKVGEVMVCKPFVKEQQYEISQVPLQSSIKTGYQSASDMPAWIKPYYVGEVATKSDTGSYDSFSLSDFVKKRAGYYLTHGCSPIPTQSCGTLIPELDAKYVGMSVWSVDKNIGHVPWKVAIKPSSMGSTGMATCVYDPACANSATNKTDFVQDWLHGCNAGGKSMCKFCGFGDFENCPKFFDCDDGGFHKGLWSQEKRDWCFEHFSIGGDPPHDCLKDINDWISWPPEKKEWCCANQEVACPYECVKTDKATWSENHHLWCQTFGKQDYIDGFKGGQGNIQIAAFEMTDKIPVKEVVRFATSSPITLACVLAGIISMGAIIGFWKRSRIEHSRRTIMPDLDGLDSETEALVEVWA